MQASTVVSLTKEEREWNKQLNQHLDKYSNLRDWSELAAWLTKLRVHLLDYKSTVIDKVFLLKRLATSLNGSLPIALHEATLDIYELIFPAVVTLENLHHACIGLFSFYSIANIKNKQKVIAIFTANFPLYGNDLRLLVTGLLITILPSFNEMHDGLIQDVTNFLEIISREEVVGSQILIQSIWVAILRSPLCRIAGLKYMSSKLGKGIVQDEGEEQDTFWNDSATIRHEANGEEPLDESRQEPAKPKGIILALKDVQIVRDLLKEYCFKTEALIVSALVVCIEDSNVLVIKIALDFLYKYMPLRSDVILDQSKLRLSTPVIWLLGKRDMSVTRKINLWLFGKPDEENHYMINEKNLKFIVLPLIKFLQNDTSIEPLKIIFNLYTEHQNLMRMTLSQLAKETTWFCLKQESNPEVFKLMSRLMDKNKEHIFTFSTSLGRELMASVHREDYSQATHLLRLLSHLTNRMLKPEELKLVVFSVLKVVMESYCVTFWRNHSYMNESLKNAIELMEKHRELLRDVSLQEDELAIIGTHHKLHRQLINIINKLQGSKGVHYEEEIALINCVQVRIYQMFDIYHEQWMANLISNAALQSPAHYLSAIEVIGQGMERDGSLKQELQKKAEEPGKANCLRNSMVKVWGVLNNGSLQARVIALLLRLIKYFPHFFEALLDGQFQSNSETAIIKFSLFWEASVKYLHVISQDHLEQVCKPGLFKMLQFLDDGNPLMKYNTNIWINDCFPSFFRVINPLLEIMLKSSNCWYRTFQGQYIYVIPPDNCKLMKALHYLKSIIQHTSMKFNKFTQKALTSKIQPYYQIFKEGDTGDESQTRDANYMTVLLELLVRFTESKYICVDNPGIDLAACEVLESLICNVNTNVLSNHIFIHNIGDMLRSLHFATVNEEHLLQIQLLNLLKIIFFGSNMRKLAEPKLLKEIISKSIFVTTILEGVHSSFPYIKERFVQFLNEAIMLLLEYHSNCSEVVSLILNTYTTKIAMINSVRGAGKDYKQEADILILFKGVKELLSYFIDMQIVQFQKQKSQNDNDSGIFSLYSWKSFVQLQIQPKKPESSRAKRYVQDISKQITNELPELLFTMVECWTISDLHPYYKLTLQGLALFDYEQFYSFNKQLYNTIGKFQGEDTIESFIVSFVRVLINTHPKELINAIINNWGSAKRVDTQIKILELLNFSCVPLEQFYSTLTACLQQDKPNRKKKAGQFDFERNIEQSILQFAQVFTHYNFQNFSVFQTQNLISLWLSFCAFLKIFENTRNVLTLYALLELIDLFMKKNNPKEILKDEKLRRELNCVLTMLNDLILVCSGKIRIIVSNRETLLFQDFLPLPSSVFEHYVKSCGDQGKAPYFSFTEIPVAKAMEYSRIHGFLIAKRVIYNLLTALHSDSDIMLVKKMREVVGQFLPIVEDKLQLSMLVESASDVVLAMLEKKHTFLREFKDEILQIFNKDDFFICSSKTLHTWARIVDLIIDANKDHDIFHEYLEKVSLVSSIFSSYNLETKKKIKSFERICFILYAGRKDKYNDKAHLLIDKIIEVIKDTEAPQPVLILIFFCIRILILRMSPEKLSKLLSSLWQMIILLLVNIFTDSLQRNRLNLLWAALKLIEMVSIMEIAQFHSHQWIFFYDFVGVKFLTGEGPGPEIKLSIRPKIQDFLSSSIRVYKDKITQGEESRHLIIKEDKIDDVELLKTKALLLSSYMISNNEGKKKFDVKEMEELIDNDFLHLDEFIYKFK